MSIIKFDHVSIYTRQPEKEIEFYGEFFGYKLESHHEISSMKIHVYHLKKGGDHLELISPTDREILTEDGIRHIAFLSDDIKEDFRSFKNRGADLLHDEVERHQHSALFFMRGPSGEFIEVIQHF